MTREINKSSLDWEESDGIRLTNYKLTRECLTANEQFLNKLKQKSENTVYPWDWLTCRCTCAEKKDDQIEDDYLLTKVHFKEFETTDTQVKKRIREDDAEKNVEDKIKKTCSLSQDSLEKVKALSQILHQPGNTKAFTNLLQILSQVSLSEVEMICDEIRLDHLEESSLVSACNVLIDEGGQLGIGVLLFLLRRLLFQKIRSLTRAPSQLFISTVTDLSRRYPRNVYDSIAIDLVQDVNVGHHQVDILCSLLKDCFTDDIKLIFFNDFLARKPIWNEILLKLPQLIIDLKVSLSNDQVSNLIQVISRQSLDSSLKFSRLIQSTLNVHGKSMNCDDLALMTKVTENNTTLLKRSLNRAIARLKNAK